MADKLLTIDELLTELARYNHKELHVHHTWQPNHSNFDGKNYQRVQDGMRNSHIRDRGFEDIAQHVTLFPDGVFMTGRNFGKTPASIKGFNTGGFCVEMVGDFDNGRDKFEGKQKAAMLALAAWFDKRGKYVRFHRENAPKTCPGTSIDKAVFMAEARALNAKPAPAKPAKQTTVKKPSAPAAPVVKPAAPASGDATIRAIQKKYGAAVDGIYGPATKKALLKGFQRAVGVAADGVWGPKTKAAAKVVREGASGELAYLVQELCYCAGFDPQGIDGKVGKNTVKAVKAWQKAEKLKSDGIVGPATWGAMFK